MSETSESSADRNVEIWKIKKLIKSLQAARGLDFSQLYFVLLDNYNYISYCSITTITFPIAR